MKIAIPKERRPNESRVAASPETVKKFKDLGFDISVEKGAGEGANFLDEDYKSAGASISKDAKSALGSADIVLKVQGPDVSGKGNELSMMKKGAILIAQLNALSNKKDVEAIAKAGVTAFAMELMPRITRAQSMDVLSSQSNLAGYLAVIEAAREYDRAIPMMMTAAGTIAPARVLVLGVGVAGLQAIATAKRLGGSVFGYDVRPAVKEQVESLGGKFVEVDPEATKEAESEGGYAKEMSKEYQKKQAQVLADTLKKMDIAICTALIPGKKAPVLIDEKMVKSMRPGSIIVDLAVEQGGNCPLSEAGKIVEKHGVKIIGHANMPARLAEDASALFSRNLFNFLSPQVDKDKKKLAIDWEDDTVSGTCVCKDGKVVHPMLTGEKPKKSEKKESGSGDQKKQSGKQNTTGDKK